MTDPLETRIAQVLAEHHLWRHFTSIEGFRSCRCSCGAATGCKPFGSWAACEPLHHAHVAAEIARALGAETRVEWRAVCSHGATYEGPEPTDSVCKGLPMRHQSHAVTTIPPLVGDWQETDS